MDSRVQRAVLAQECWRGQKRGQIKSRDRLPSRSMTHVRHTKCDNEVGERLAVLLKDCAVGRGGLTRHLSRVTVQATGLVLVLLDGAVG